MASAWPGRIGADEKLRWGGELHVQLVKTRLVSRSAFVEKVEAVV